MAHDQAAVGLNPGTVYWMNVSNASYYIQENNKNKGSRMGLTTKKIIKNSYETGFYKPTILQMHSLISVITAHATMPGKLEHSIISFCSTL